MYEHRHCSISSRRARAGQAVQCWWFAGPLGWWPGARDRSSPFDGADALDEGVVVEVRELRETSFGLYMEVVVIYVNVGFLWG